MNVLKRIFLTAVLLATASSSVVLSDATKVSAWAYNVNNQYTAPYINYPSVITIGNPENQYVRAYGYTRNRIDKSGEHHVRAIQCFLNVSVDGNIGPITDSAIKAYQNANNL